MFREFLRCEYSEENILFWMACEDLKKETSPEKVEELVVVKCNLRLLKSMGLIRK